MQENTVKISEIIGGRLDPSQFHWERIEAIRNLNKYHKTLKLHEVVKNVKTTTTKITNNDIYIGLENIVSNTGEYVATNEKTSISSAAIFKKGDILFPKLRPYLNKVHFAQFDGKCSTEFYVFEATKIDPQFLTIYLRSDLIVNQTKHLMTGNTLPRLQTDDVMHLLIPNISLDIQNAIVSLYNSAYSQKQLKEKEALKLYNSIDEYLVDELGLILPEEEVASKYFKVNISQLVGDRLDVSFYKNTFQFLTQHIPLFKLSHVAEINPSIKFEGLLQNDEVSFIPMDIINERDATITRTITRRLSENKGFTKFQEEDILWAKITPCMQNKKSAIARNLVNGFGFGSTEFYVIRANHNVIINDYLLFLLRNTNVLNAAQLSFGGSAGQQRVPVAFLKNLLIPIPSLEKQKEIILHISRLREKIKGLEKEALSIFTEASKKVEKMIIN